jgi:hypothetical protein
MDSAEHKPVEKGERDGVGQMKCSVSLFKGAQERDVKEARD